MALALYAVANARDLYLLIGQSNMAGRGTVTDANRLSSDRVVKFTADEKWAEGVEPIHYDRKTVGAGPGLAFARVLADADAMVQIGLVPCAEGGSPLSRWQPGADLYARAVQRTKAALATGGVLKGILWHQGESDSWTKENATTYGVRLTNMVTRLRAELGVKYVPFIAGEVGAHYGESITKRGGTSFVATVNEQIKWAVRQLPAAGWVSAEGLVPGPDGIHFTTESAYTLGRRYAAELQRWQSVPNQMLTDEDYGGAAADWKPSFSANGFNLQGMRMARPGVGYDPRHFKWIHDWGFNFVRLPLDYRCWVKDRLSANREIIDESGLKPLDDGIAAARRHQLVPMVCIHRLPGEYCVYNVQPEPGNLYTDPDCLRAAVKHWTLLARRYRDVPREELFFNLINEPSANKGNLAQYEYVCRVLIAAIRKADPRRYIVADGWATSTVPVTGLYDVPGVGQATRGYYPFEFSHFGLTVGADPSKESVPQLAPLWPPDSDAPNGRLGGPRWPDWHAPFALEDAPAGDYSLALNLVSGPVTIRVMAEGAPVATFTLEPKEHDEDWYQLSKYKGTGPWRGTYLKTLNFSLTKRVKRLEIQVVKGDWAMPRQLVIRDAEEHTFTVMFGGDRKVMKNVAWARRFVGWDEPLAFADGCPRPAAGRYGDAGMDAVAKGFIEAWRKPVEKGIWCLMGEFGCANHVAHDDALRFVETNLKVCQAIGIGWCDWGFIGSRFGILNSYRKDVDYEDWEGAKLDRQMLELLQRYAKDAPPVAPMTISKTNPRYFVSAGETFVPIGVNLCYCRDRDVKTGYLEWLDRFSTNGGNYIRLWCGNATWDVMPRFNEIDPEAVERLRWIADECGKRGVRIKLTLEQFRGFGDDQPPVFRKEIYAPYVKTMTEWFTNGVCQAAFRKKIDAIAAAVGDHPAVAVIEIWNEIMTDWGRVQTAWQTETLAYMRRKFPGRLIVCNLGSFSEVDSGITNDRICAREDNDFLQAHRYYDPGAGMAVCYGPIDFFCADAIRELFYRRTDKPALLAEVGAVKPGHMGLSDLYAKDPEGVLMHDMVFAPFFAGAAGCGQMWHWDSRYVDGNGLWHHYGRFVRAIAGLDPVAEDFKPFRGESKAYRFYGLRGRKTTVIWLRDKRVDALAEIRDGKAPEVRTNWKLPMKTEGQVDAYLPWEDRHETARTEGNKICLPPFRRSIVLRFRTPEVW